MESYLDPEESGASKKFAWGTILCGGMESLGKPRRCNYEGGCHGSQDGSRLLVVGDNHGAPGSNLRLATGMGLRNGR